MFERFTDRARRVIVLAQEEARMLGHDWISPEHLLLGLIREGRSAATQVLTGAGVDLKRVRQQVIELLPGPDEQDAPSSPSAYVAPIGDDLVRRLNSFAERLDAIERRLSQAG